MVCCRPPKIYALVTSDKKLLDWRPSLLGWRPLLLVTRSYYSVCLSPNPGCFGSSLHHTVRCTGSLGSKAIVAVEVHCHEDLEKKELWEALAHAGRKGRKYSQNLMQFVWETFNFLVSRYGFFQLQKHDSGRCGNRQNPSKIQAHAPPPTGGRKDKWSSSALSFLQRVFFRTAHAARFCLDVGRHSHK